MLIRGLSQEGTRDSLLALLAYSIVLLFVDSHQHSSPALPTPIVVCVRVHGAEMTV